MSRLLYRMGALLPLLLNGPDLARECCELEMLCWRELGHLQQPNFDWCLPPFLRLDADGHSVELSSPIDPKVVGDRMAALEPLPLAAASPVGVNLNRLSCLLNLTSFESQWLVWSYCVKRFGHAILPVIAISDDRQGGEVLALLTDMPIGAVRDAVASRRLHVWCLLDGISTDGEMPSLLSGWLSATDQFADWIEQPYASDSELLTALCQAQVSLMASR